MKIIQFNHEKCLIFKDGGCVLYRTCAFCGSDIDVTMDDLIFDKNETSYSYWSWYCCLCGFKHQEKISARLGSEISEIKKRKKETA